MVYYGSYSSNTRDPLSGDRRAVFLLSKGVAVVVKFISGVGYASVKIWDTTQLSLERTISSWRTNSRYDASVGEVMSAYDFARRSLTESSQQISGTLHSVK